MKLYNRKFSVRLALLRALIENGEPLVYSDLMKLAQVNDNISTRNIISQMKTEGLVKSIGLQGHFEYYVTHKGTEYMYDKNMRKVKSIMGALLE